MPTLPDRCTVCGTEFDPALAGRKLVRIEDGEAFCDRCEWRMAHAGEPDAAPGRKAA